ARTCSASENRKDAVRGVPASVRTSIHPDRQWRKLNIPLFSQLRRATLADVRGTVKSADGVAVRYEVLGSGTPAVVFVHGWSCDRRYWREQVDHFAERFTVVTVDLAGHG